MLVCLLKQTLPINGVVPKKFVLFFCKNVVWVLLFSTDETEFFQIFIILHCFNKNSLVQVCKCKCKCSVTFLWPFTISFTDFYTQERFLPLLFNVIN